MQVENIEWCQYVGEIPLSGQIVEGTCKYMLSDGTRRIIGKGSFAKELLGADEVKDAGGKVITPAKPPMLCTYTTHVEGAKTNLESACRKAGSFCDFETQKKIEEGSVRIDSVKNSAQNLKKQKPR